MSSCRWFAHWNLDCRKTPLCQTCWDWNLFSDPSFIKKQNFPAQRELIFSKIDFIIFDVPVDDPNCAATSWVANSWKISLSSCENWVSWVPLSLERVLLRTFCERVNFSRGGGLLEILFGVSIIFPWVWSILEGPSSSFLLPDLEKIDASESVSLGSSRSSSTELAIFLTARFFRTFKAAFQFYGFPWITI